MTRKKKQELLVAYSALQTMLDDLGAALDDVTTLTSAIAFEDSEHDLSLLMRAMSDALTDAIETIGDRAGELEEEIEEGI